MKLLLTLTLTASLFATGLASSAFAENLLPGQVDFGEFTPSADGGEFVEVNLSGNLISMAARFIEKQEPDIAAVVKGIHLVRVNVIGVSEANKPDLQKRMDKVRHDLEGKGWEKVVTAREKDQDVGVYIKTANKDTVQGLAVTVMDGNKQAVFVNIVGDIKPDQLAMLGEKLHIDPLKKIGGVTVTPESDK
jgi:hypothetical protein